MAKSRIRNPYPKTILIIVRLIKEMVPSGFSAVMPFLEGYLKESVQNFIDTNMDGNSRTASFEFRIRVPNDTYLLRGFSPEGTTNSKKSI